MGIPLPLIEFFLQEHNYRPWAGKLLTLGRQTICADAAQLKEVLGRYGRTLDPASVRIDRRTVQAQASPEKNYVDDATLFSSFSSARLDALDVTDYEGANIVHNLCSPLPAALKGAYDVVFNGSVLDNLFDPAQGLRNMTQLLAPGGRVIHLEMASNLAFEYLIYSTDWFLDYYVVNDFADCRVYVCTFETVDQLLYGPWRVYAYLPKPDGTAFTLRSLPFKQAVLVIIAESGSNSRYDEAPVQWCYRDEKMKRSFNDKLARLSEARPIFGYGRPQQRLSNLRPGGFLDCGLTGT